MDINVPVTLLAGFVASVVWFTAGSVLYLNPFVARIYKGAEGSPGLKRWSNVPAYIGMQFVGILAQCLLWAFVFVLMKPVLGAGFVRTFLIFGIILFAVKIFPRFYDMWMQSTYPVRLLAVEFINGTISSFVIAAVFALII